MSGLSIAGGSLIGVFLSCYLYGVFTVLFCISTYVLCYKKATSRPNRLLFVASVVLYLSTTAYIVLSSYQAFDALILSAPGADPDDDFLNLNSWTYGLQDACIYVNMLTADAIMIYRCWAVWQYRWRVVVLNVILWVLTIVISCLIVYYNARFSLDDHAVAISLGVWNKANLSVTLLQTVIATGLIAFRLWRVDKAAGPYKQSSLVPVMWVVVESGALYAATVLAALIATVAQINGGLQFTFDYMLISMIGVTFSLIIVRVGLGLTKTSSHEATPFHTTESHPVHTLGISVHRETELESSGTNDDASEFNHTRTKSLRGSQTDLHQMERRLTSSMPA